MGTEYISDTHVNVSTVLGQNWHWCCPAMLARDTLTSSQPVSLRPNESYVSPVGIVLNRLSYTEMYYLSQEIQSKLQVLQPLSVDGVNFGELGSESRFLQESSQQSTG